MPRTTCSDAGKNLAACRWRKHNKKKARAKFQAEKAANQAKKAAKAAKAKKLQAAAVKQKALWRLQRWSASDFSVAKDFVAASASARER